jgi:guanylate kinase
MARARAELSHYGEDDYLVVNDRFEDALSDLGCVVRAERLRHDRRAEGLLELLAGLDADVVHP